MGCNSYLCQVDRFIFLVALSPFGLLTIYSSISLILEDVPLATTGKDLALDARLVLHAGLSAMVLFALVLWTFLGPQQKPAGCAVLRAQQQPCALEFV